MRKCFAFFVFCDKINADVKNKTTIKVFNKNFQFTKTKALAKLYSAHYEAIDRTYIKFVYITLKNVRLLFILK